MNRSISVASHRGPYKVFFESDFSFLKRLLERDAVWIIDNKVRDIYAARFADIPASSIIGFEAEEKNKTIEAAVIIIRSLQAMGCKRNTPIISIGGGITQDVTGFVASILYRGLDWTYIPTTLLAQADSCIGGKTSLNFDSVKNPLGTFYAPNQVYICEEFLKTLDWKEIASGMGEIVKLNLIRSRGFDGLVNAKEFLRKNDLPELIIDSLLIKKEFIEEDEFDNGRRRILNYGHCFGHALEAVSDFSIPHGIAVVAGMVFASIVAKNRGLLALISGEMHVFSVNEILLPRMHASSFKYEEVLRNSHGLWQAMAKDKKRTGEGVAIILPSRYGEPNLVQDLSRIEFDQAIQELCHIIENPV